MARRRLPESALALTDAEFEATLETHLPSPRDRRDFLYGYRQTIEDLDLDEIHRIPGWFADAARRAKQAGFDGVELHFAHAYTMASFLSVTNGRTDRYGGSFENRMRLPLEVVEAVRGAVGREFLVGCRYLGSEDILGEDGTLRGNTLADAQAIGVALARAGLDFLSISRGGKFDDARQPPVGESAYPYTGHSGGRCIPREKRDPFGGERAAGGGDTCRTAGRRLHDPGGHRRQDRLLRSGRGDPARRLRRPRGNGSGTAGGSGPSPQVAHGSRRRRKDLRLLPVLRGRGSASPRRDVHTLAEGPGPPPAPPDARRMGERLTGLESRARLPHEDPVRAFGRSRLPRDPGSHRRLRRGAEPPDPPAKSPRNANYSIDARLDPAQHTIDGNLVLEWRNTGDAPLSTFPFHLYWNAFRNTLSTSARGEGPRGARFDDTDRGLRLHRI